VKKFQEPRVLGHDLSIDVPYELLPREEIRSFANDQSNKTFNARFPLAGGYYWFSAVGFDEQKIHAIVQVGFRCGSVCGQGGTVFLEKRDGVWRKTGVNGGTSFWVS
jgi:hypothetical protein